VDRALDSLARRYAGEPGLVRRGGRTYPVTAVQIGGATGLAVGDAVRLGDGRTTLDAALVAGGRAHLDALRAGGRVHDGAVLCLDAVITGTGLTLVRGSYFDMLASCDVLRAELLADDAGLPLRGRAHQVAGDPMTSGRGRAAAVGVSVLLGVRLPDGGRGLVLGRRSARVGADRGRWHVAPSGMLGPAADGRHLATTVATELREELGLDLPVAQVADTARAIGVITDLYRLRPDVVVRLDVDAEPAELVAGEEFDSLDVVPLTPAGLADLWRRRPPETLTPAAAGALALALHPSVTGSYTRR
jgi:8-oxo-dGTP pyrophosphatase MutT (NUDIX family)